MMESLLRVPPGVACPARALDGFRSREARKPYFTQLLTPSTSPQHLLAVCDEPSLMVLDKRRLKTPVRRIPLSEAESVTCVADVDFSHAAWLSASRGGFLVLWDARASASAPQQRFSGPSGAPYLSLATSGPGAAAGTELQGPDAFVDLWDLRQPGVPVLSYDEAHSDDVTTLMFHPDTAQHGGVLLSGGMDGLVCAIDTQIVDADDAVIAVGNTDASLARAGWARAPAQYVSPARPDAADKDLEEHDAALQNDPRRRALGPVYAVSNMQTLSIWDADKFDCAASELAVRAPTSFKPSWATDYVIDASGAYPVAPETSEAVVTPMFVGDQEGGMALITAETLSSGETSWTLHARFPSAESGAFAHTDIVRCIEWDATANRLFTGGEDGSVLVWDPSSGTGATPHSTLPTEEPGRGGDGGDGPSRGKLRGGGGSAAFKHRFNPYRQST